MPQREALMVSFYSPSGDFAQELLGADVIPFHKRIGDHFSLGWYARIDGEKINTQSALARALTRQPPEP